MLRRPPRSTRTATLFPSAPLFRSDGHGKPALFLDQAKARDVGRAVADEHHVLKRYGPVTLLDELVDLAVVAQVEGALVDAEQILRLGRVVDGQRGPCGNAVLVEPELRRIDMGELRSEARSVGKECVSKCRSRWWRSH